MSPKTLYEKLWDAHCVDTDAEGTSLLYIDRHILHEVTSPQAFEGLALANRPVWRLSSLLATPDHQVPTTDRAAGISGITDNVARLQVETLAKNCETFKVPNFPLNDARQGIVHVVGPEQGATLPGMTVVCGDSHTSTHGAFAALAQGIGTSEVEHVLATQCLVQRKAKSMQIIVDGKLNPGVTAKDLILYVVGQIGSAGGTGYAIEYAGEAIRSLSMEGRMTICNMTIEAGATVGMVAYDNVTEAYVKGRPGAPKGDIWDAAIKSWRDLVSDEGAVFDAVHRFRAEDIQPHVSWGTVPDMSAPIDGQVPNPADAKNPAQRDSWTRALDYMGLTAGQKITDIEIDRVFIGSCTNSRIEDLRAVAAVVAGKRVSPRVREALVVPGSGLVKAQAEKEGIAQILIDAGFEWRDAGCSMCVGMNPDRIGAGERCASTSNRNFEGRQGAGGRTHLVSPAMAAAAAIAGHFVDVRRFGGQA